MYKRHTRKTLAKICLIFSCSLIPQVSSAVEEVSDLVQEVQIAAKHNSANLKSKVASYKENVVITQGNIKIVADEATVFTDLISDQKTYRLMGNPVRFERTEQNGFLVTAQAKEMQYKPGIRELRVSGNAELAEQRSKVTGESILYNIETKAVDAKGNPVAFHRKLTDGTPIDILGSDVSYEPTSRIVSVSGNAVVRQVGTEVKGSRMTYNVDTEQLNVDSSHNETVTTIIQPKQKKDN